MCGLAGIVGPIDNRDIEMVSGMARSMHHRGPDAGGIKVLDSVVLGHRRLRIIDLRPEADQPVTDEFERFWLLFNGEIYNFPELRACLENAGHRFHSDSDTEVIVHLVEEYGDDFPRHLRGMFAVAVWDTKDKSLLLVRDRLGIKPLYYQTAGSRLLFSSEANVLPAAQRGLDEYALACYLNLGWVPGPRTAFRDVLELPPGHRLRWRAGVTRVDRWCEPPDEASAFDADVLSETLVDAVRRHLVADVPVGIFLSSGLDSAVIATITAALAGDVTAYTAAFDDGVDETEGARELAARLGLRHDVVTFSGADVLPAIEAFIQDMDQPTVDGLNSWVISRGVRERGAVVALSGVGGDELFGGYSTFRYVPKLTRLLGPSTRLPQSLRAAPGAVFGLASRTAHSRYRRVLDAARQPTPGVVYAAVRGPMCPGEVEKLRGGWGRDLRRRPPIVADGTGATVRDLELANYLSNQLLRDTDTMSMAHSLEVRVPLLDDEVVAATAALGAPLDKGILANSVDPALQAIAAAPKRTFTLPIGLWLQGPIRDWTGDMLHGLADAGLGFDRRGLFCLSEEFQAGRVDWRALWSLCVLGAWISRSRATAPPG